MNDIVAVAVSGGVDSMVLLDQLFHSNTHNNILVLYFDHSLRDNKKEIDLIKSYCLDKNLKVIMGINKNKFSIDEASLRIERLKFFKNQQRIHGFKTLYLGHHREDYIQTLFFNIIRGVDIYGLFPMRSGSKIYQSIRPLMNYSKAQIYQYAIYNGLDWVEDNSNILYSYSRNMIRKMINIDNTNLTQNVNLTNGSLLKRINNHSQKILSILIENRADGIFFNYYPLLGNDNIIKFLLKKTIKSHFKINILDQGILGLISIINKQKAGDKWHSGSIIATVYTPEWLRLSINR